MDYWVETESGVFLIEDVVRQMNADIVAELVNMRKESAMTQQDIADATGITRPNVARIEGGKHNTSLEVLMKYADCLGKRIEYRLVDK